MNRAGDSIRRTDLGFLVNLGAKNPMDSPKSDTVPRSIGAVPLPMNVCLRRSLNWKRVTHGDRRSLANVNSFHLQFDS